MEQTTTESITPETAASHPFPFGTRVAQGLLLGNYISAVAGVALTWRDLIHPEGFDGPVGRSIVPGFGVFCTLLFAFLVGFFLTRRIPNFVVFAFACSLVPGLMKVLDIYVLLRHIDFGIPREAFALWLAPYVVYATLMTLASAYLLQDASAINQNK